MSLSARALTKSHFQAGHKISVLDGLELEIKPSETVAIVGRSGSGKSTLLSLLAGLDGPDSGEVWLGDRKITGLTETHLAQVRAQRMGIIFQQFHLVQTLNALENVMLPAEILKRPDAHQKSLALLKDVGLENRNDHFPHQLSGGEQQRVAIARALSGNPQILLADEPTGNLDNETGKKVMDLLFGLVETNGLSMVLVTHDEELAKRCHRTLHLRQGRLWA